MTKKSLFKKVPETVLFERVLPVQKFFEGYNSYTYIITHMRAPSLKVSSPVDHICRSESVKVIKESLKVLSVDQTSTLCAKYSTKFDLKPNDKGSQIVKF